MSFRPLLRIRQALSDEECLSLLKSQLRGVLSVLGDDDYPYGMPMDHYYDEEDGCLYFHGAGKGHKIDAIQRHDKVSYCVYDEGYKEDGDWALHIRSVIVFGRMAVIKDQEKIAAIARKLSYCFTDDTDYIENEIRKDLDRTMMLVLRPEHISGKTVTEK